MHLFDNSGEIFYAMFFMHKLKKMNNILCEYIVLTKAMKVYIQILTLIIIYMLKLILIYISKITKIML